MPDYADSAVIVEGNLLPVEPREPPKAWRPRTERKAPARKPATADLTPTETRTAPHADPGGPSRYLQ